MHKLNPKDTQVGSKQVSPHHKYEAQHGATGKAGYGSQKEAKDNTHRGPKARQDGAKQDKSVSAADHRFSQEHADKGHC